MTSQQYAVFSDFRRDFKEYCKEKSQEFGSLLMPLQKEAAEKDTPAYPLENPVVYNTALDEITEQSQIRLIVIGDNPGKDEQLSKNQKYLVGQSGKIAASFFQKNPQFHIDFRKNAIILNKTPVHTAKTKHLKFLAAQGGEKIRRLLQESQLYMAQKTARLHLELCNATQTEAEKPKIFLVGYSELKKNGIFTTYREELKKNYDTSPEEWKKVFVFQHFSMNRFSIDLKEYMKIQRTQDIVQSADILGTLHKTEIFSESSFLKKN